MGVIGEKEDYFQNIRGCSYLKNQSQSSLLTQGWSFAFKTNTIYLQIIVFYANEPPQDSFLFPRLAKKCEKIDQGCKMLSQT